MAQPRVRDGLRTLAGENGVCCRPLAVRRVERETGRVDGFKNVPCGARLASKCENCARENLKLRRRQIREGWHLREEPTVIVQKPTKEVLWWLQLGAELELIRDTAERVQDWTEVAWCDERIAEVNEALAGQRVRGELPKPEAERKPRMVRSTRRRKDFGSLPTLKVENRSIGRLYIGRNGRVHNHSLLMTVTLPSFGAVHTGHRTRRGHLVACPCGKLHGFSDPILGTPMDPETYDYRAHAKALVSFPGVQDRFWQNLRRTLGWKVSYAGAVEMQKRLATHAHYAVRGTIPRKLIQEVAAQTYHQVWWPQFDVMLYSPQKPPVWDEDASAYVDPKTGQALPTWEQAIAATKGEEEPAYTATLGTVDVRGFEAGTPDAERAIRYITKYITKDLVDHTFIRGEAQQEHFQRLFEELSMLPCSSRCGNWLLYGVQPKDAKKGLVPGRCKGKVHQPATLGYTGRRCLVSRNWSNKTLTDHRLDGREWFRAVTDGLLGEQAQAEEDDKHKYFYELAGPHDLDVPSQQRRIQLSIANRYRHRLALQLARDRERGSGVPATPPAAGQHQGPLWTDNQEEAA